MYEDNFFAFLVCLRSCPKHHVPLWIQYSWKRDKLWAEGQEGVVQCRREQLQRAAEEGWGAWFRGEGQEATLWQQRNALGGQWPTGAFTLQEEEPISIAGGSAAWWRSWVAESRPFLWKTSWKSSLWSLPPGLPGGQRGGGVGTPVLALALAAARSQQGPWGATTSWFCDSRSLHLEHFHNNNLFLVQMFVSLSHCYFSLNIF